MKIKDIEKFCLECGERLKLRAARDIERKKFCSRSCSSSYNVRIGKAGMTGRKHTDEFRERRSKETIGRYAGEKNPKYIDGRTIFRKILLKVKPQKKCCICGREDGYFIAHHVNPCERTNDRARSIISGDHSSDNLDWMCASCHKKWHLNLKKEVENAVAFGEMC